MLESLRMAKKKNNKAATKKSGETKFRTPIVAVMGHVDHGKTTLLDTIRGARVVDTEEGGITQNTRAHQVTTDNGNKITFIDTPGHEAFSAMRARGAEVTDFVLLVVAADDGIQAQTKESIDFALETKTPIVVAINKMDMPGADPAKVKRELSQFGVNVEEFGGETMVFEVSALKNEGITELIEGIELLSEIHELKPNDTLAGTMGAGYVLESSIEKSIGSVALCVLKNGEMNGRVLGVSNNDSFKVRAFLDQDQKQTKAVHESDPFWVTGLNEPLNTGDTVYFVDSDKAARSLLADLQSETSESTEPKGDSAADQSGNELLLQMMAQRTAEEEGYDQKTLNIIVRASTKGTLEAVEHELNKLGDDESTVKIISQGVGVVTESDIQLAKTAGAIVVSFQMPTDKKVASMAKQNKIIVRNYEIIYEMVDELGGALDGLVEPEEEEVEVARARVKQIFVLSDGTIVAGSEVVKGTILKGYNVYVERPHESTNEEIAEVGRGKISSLREGKNEVKEVKKGLECGIIINPQVEEIQEGDEVVAYKVER